MNKIKLTETPTPVHYYAEFELNNIYIKRDDLTDLALGGNKARKLEYFLADALKDKNTDCIVTYGAPQSNHCRITAAAASKYGLKTVIIHSKDEELNFGGNYFLNYLFDTEVVWTDVSNVPNTIEDTLNALKERGYTPYFIQGGGHGNLGTHAYKEAFDEILKNDSIDYDYIFHASGTGTTQAGLIAGKIMHESATKIIGISVARNEARGKEVIANSLIDYLQMQKYDTNQITDKVTFLDTYVGKGYADIYPEILDTIKDVAKKSAILLDPVYTGKAFYGMLDYIKKNSIQNKKILFIHTGGSPLLFNYATSFMKEYNI